MNLYQVTYTITAVIAAKDESEACTQARNSRGMIFADLQGEADMEIEKLSADKHNWKDDFIPYGNNPDELSIAGLITEADWASEGVRRCA